MKVQHLIAVSFAFISALLSMGVQADTFDDAVNEYIKGYKACTDANTLRTENLQQAKTKFDLYLKHLERAKTIDPSILQTSNRDMDSNLRYCERVEVNIKRAEAAPILEKGFTYCDDSKEALKNGDVNSAKSNMDEYKSYRDNALKITESIMDVFALASKVRSCGRLEGKITEAIQEESVLIASLNSAITEYQAIIATCSKARSTVKASNFSHDQLGSVNQLMDNVTKAKKTAWKNQKAFSLLAEQPNRPESKQLQQLVDQAAACEGETSELIRVATNNKRNNEKFILGGVATLNEAQKACESAQLISNRATNSTELTKAETRYKDSAALKQSVVNNAKLINAVKNNPSWSASQQFSRLMKNTEQCQQAAVNAIQTQKKALVQQESVQQKEAALQAQRQKEEQERQAREAEDARRKAEQKRLAEQEKNRQSASEDPLFNDDVANDPEFDDLDDEKEDQGGSGKSWTDLIR